MLTLEQAIQYGKQVGVKYYVVNQHGCILGGSASLKGAEQMAQKFNREKWAGIAHVEKVKEK